jgi:hypothetical protein
MKTLIEVSRQSQYPKLVKAVIRRIGLDSVQDVVNHGIDGGFNGFIYYADTVAFFNRHRKDILSLAKDMSESLGENMLSMIQSFNCLGKDYSRDEIARALYQGKGESCDIIKNALAWFAAEEAAIEQAKDLACSELQNDNAGDFYFDDTKCIESN